MSKLLIYRFTDYGKKNVVKKNKSDNQRTAKQDIINNGIQKWSNQ